MKYVQLISAGPKFTNSNNYLSGKFFMLWNGESKKIIKSIIFQTRDIVFRHLGIAK